MSSVTEDVAALVFPVATVHQEAEIDVGVLTVLPGLLEVPDTVLVVCGRPGVDTSPIVRDLLGGMPLSYLRAPARFHFAATPGPADDLRLPGASSTVADIGLPHPRLRDGLIVINLPSVEVASADTRAILDQADVVLVVVPAEATLTAADAQLMQWVAERVAEPPIVVVGTRRRVSASVTAAIREQAAALAGPASRSLVLDGAGPVEQVISDVAERRRSTRFATGLASAMSLTHVTGAALVATVNAFELQRKRAHDRITALSASVEEGERTVVE
ncbi:hypothetical protein AB0M20_43875, partial [Actinoplanes sp. NPDC051633]|uniref:hypothetical protein n=1 Tax=Actinoplanes sp. NPDC051633 TaxID=3155670 RepID=UPI003432C93C